LIFVFATSLLNPIFKDSKGIMSETTIDLANIEEANVED
jgi:hypothetical protein